MFPEGVDKKTLIFVNKSVNNNIANKGIKISPVFTYLQGQKSQNHS